MLRWWFRVLVALFFSSFVAELVAQYAKDLPPGTSRDAVIRAYGWPKGRSSTGEREIWTYDRFQVRFESGRVMDVTVLKLPKPTPSKARSYVPSSIERSTQPKSTSTSPPTTRPNPAPGSGNPQRPPVISPPVTPQPRRSIAAPEQPAKPSENVGSGLVRKLVWILAAGFVVVATGGIMVAIRNRRAEKEEQLKRAAAEAAKSAMDKSAARRSWEEQVAETLSRANGEGPPSPPPVLAPALDGDPLARAHAPVPAGKTTFESLSPDLLRRLEWKRFELIVELYFNTTGVRAQSTCIGADGGVDVQLFRSGEDRPFAYVQCKAFNASYKVRVALLRELYGVMAAEGVTEGYFVTSGKFTAEARQFAVGKKLTLIDGRDLIERFNGCADDIRKRILAEVTTGDYTTPTCASCDVKMIWREDREFWGCVNYPRCQGKLYVGRVVD